MNSSSRFVWKLCRKLVPGDLVITLWMGTSVDDDQPLTEREQATCRPCRFGMVVANKNELFNGEVGAIYVWTFKERMMQTIDYCFEQKVVSVR